MCVCVCVCGRVDMGEVQGSEMDRQVFVCVSHLAYGRHTDGRQVERVNGLQLHAVLEPFSALVHVLHLRATRQENVDAAAL